LRRLTSLSGVSLGRNNRFKINDLFPLVRVGVSSSPRPCELAAPSVAHTFANGGQPGFAQVYSYSLRLQTHAAEFGLRYKF
jgi:hypothetical protein